MCLLCLLRWQANSLPLSHLGIPTTLAVFLTTLAVCDCKVPFKFKGQLTGVKIKKKVWGRESLVGFNCVPAKKKKKRYVGILTPDTSEYDLIWKSGLYRGNQNEMIRVGPDPM